ncbi:hypothetical protein WN55_02003 [Dufourea novaeangliae]|uniref:Chitin-binding type-2 domain-containing protein n=1 Tax=Dufourea novaeangliae TaxID=178035 RepID=A0A154PFA6_DUFNO|nr:hypothetical protein WN55_02003 [Dufourea novaeangliae]
MWKSVYAFSVLAVLVNAGYHLRPERKQIFNPVARVLFNDTLNASPLPIWKQLKDDGFVCEQTGYYPKRTTCDQFYGCSNFQKVHFLRVIYECNAGLVYSIEKKRCTVPHESDRPECNGQQGNGTDEKIKHTSPTDEGVLGDRPNSDKKVHATSTPEPIGEKHRKQDIMDKIFELTNTTTAAVLDTITSTPPSKIKFENHTPASEIVGSSELNNPDEHRPFRCYQEGFFPVPGNCSKFYKCVPFKNEFLKYEFSCPRGTIWNDRFNVCSTETVAEQTVCGDKPRATTSTTKYQFPESEPQLLSECESESESIFELKFKSECKPEEVELKFELKLVVELETDSKSKSESMSVSELETELESIFEPECESESDSEVELEFEWNSVTELESDSELKSESMSVSELETELESIFEPECESESDSEVELEFEWNSVTELESDSELKSEFTPVFELEPELEWKLESELKSDAMFVFGLEPESESNSDFGFVFETDIDSDSEFDFMY